jgi:hypothetical protein
MSEFMRRIKKLEKGNGDGQTPYIVLFHDNEGVFRDHDGTVYLHVGGDMWRNQVNDQMVLSSLFLQESLRERI